jgi:hypothetical protein
MIPPPIVQAHNDPIYVRPSGGWVELRIGAPSPGETRYALLTPAQARKIAIELIQIAEQATPQT